MRTILTFLLLALMMLSVSCTDNRNAYEVLAQQELRSLLNDGGLVDGAYYVTSDDVGRDNIGYFLRDENGLILRLPNPNPVFLPCLEAAVTANGAMIWGRYSAPSSFIDIRRVQADPDNNLEICLLD